MIALGLLLCMGCYLFYIAVIQAYSKNSKRWRRIIRISIFYMQYRPFYIHLFIMRVPFNHMK